VVRRRPAYVEERIAVERQRREARKTHSPKCFCPYCLDHDKFQALVDAALARNAPAEEVPF
jgi:hypothetical protein